MEMTDRQQRERDYHVEHAKKLASRIQPISYDVALSTNRRWWNAYWHTFTYLRSLDEPASLRTLVVGCGEGSDALRLARLGFKVEGFDLSPELLELAREQAKQEGLSIEFREIPAERTDYPDNTFDLVFAHDILHHVDIPATMAELARVAKPGALMVVDEIYSHSVTDLVRQSRFVKDFLYARMRDFIYTGKIYYVTPDERKLTERDVRQIQNHMSNIHFRGYFNFIVTRLIPDTSVLASKVDRVLLILLGPLGRYVAGRLVFVGNLKKGTG